jgi:serine phosphatase RsbU (regulator of sigma subunit)
MERLTKVITENNSLSAEDIMHEIQKKLKTFVDGQPQFDDITLMVVKAV